MNEVALKLRHLVSFNQLGEMLGVSQFTLAKWRDQGLRAVKVGRGWWAFEPHVVDFLLSRVQGPRIAQTN